MTIVVASIVIMGGLVLWQIGASANQICRQIHHLHERMDGIYGELQNANSHLRSIRRETEKLPKQLRYDHEGGDI